MKDSEQYLPVILFTILNKVVLTFESIRFKSLSVTIQMKAVEQYFPVCYAFQKRFKGFSLWKKSQRITRSNESVRAVVSCSTVYNAKAFLPFPYMISLNVQKFK